MKIRGEVAGLSILALLLEDGATVGPDYTRPKVQEPEEWIEKVRIANPVRKSSAF